MGALSIRNMNFTLYELERIEDQKSATWYATLPADREPSHYWHVSRKAKRGKNKWIFVTDFTGTKSEAAAFFCKYFRDGNHRLRLLLTYGA